MIDIATCVSLYKLIFDTSNIGAHSWSEWLRLELSTKSCKIKPPLFRTTWNFFSGKKKKKLINIRQEISNIVSSQNNYIIRKFKC